MEITEFFCEIKCADLVSAILSRLEALNFDFSAVLHFLKGESYQINLNSEPLKWQKTANVQPLILKN